MGVEMEQTSVSVSEIEEGSGDRPSESQSSNGVISIPVLTQLFFMILGVWRESSRWVRFEETVYHDADRWSKPHVSTIHYAAFRKLKNAMFKGTILEIVENAISKTDIFKIVADTFSSTTDTDSREKIMRQLHQPIRFKDKRNGNGNGNKNGNDITNISDSTSLVRSWSNSILSRFSSLSNLSGSNFEKKLPQETEGCTILCGEADFIDEIKCVFIRLGTTLVNELSEHSIPTRFVIVILGPIESEVQEVGRAMGVLMTSNVFRVTAYSSKLMKNLAAGLDDFLDASCILPVSEWNSEMRMDPPKNLKEEENKEDTEMVEDERDSSLERTDKWFGGLLEDIKRKRKYYISDFADAVDLQTIPAVCSMYFSLLIPLVAFGSLLEDATGKNMGVIENLFGAAISGIFFSLFSGQPLIISGSTSLILVLEAQLYKYCQASGVDFLSLRFCILISTCMWLVFIVRFDLSFLVSLVTRFTEENFTVLGSLLLIYEAAKHILNIENTMLAPGAGPNGTYGYANELYRNPLTATDPQFSANYNKFFMSLSLAIGTFSIAFTLERMRNSRFFPNIVRKILAAFSLPIAIVFTTIFENSLGMNTPKLTIPSTFRLTSDERQWIVNPLETPWTHIPGVIIAGFINASLLFMDQQITAVMVNRKENKLKKGHGYHLDILTLSITILFNGLLGLPTYVADTVLSISHVNSLKIESRPNAPGEMSTFTGVREQRVTGILTFLLIGLSILASNILGMIPMSVLHGVLLFMGVSALQGLQLIERVQLMVTPQENQAEVAYIRHVTAKKIHVFTGIQVSCLFILLAIKFIYAPVFPIILVATILITKILGKVYFSRDELNYLEDEPPSSIKKEEKGSEEQQETTQT